MTRLLQWASGLLASVAFGLTLAVVMTLLAPRPPARHLLDVETPAHRVPFFAPNQLSCALPPGASSRRNL
jgi:hypothetical protein